jgi:secretion/DNA translocation related CpaE-like protein
MTWSPPARPVLLATADGVLTAEVGRLAAAAGVHLAVVTDPADVLPVWNPSAVVLVGTDLVEPLARRSTPRRTNVHVVAVSPVPDPVFRAALALGAESVVELPGAGPWLLDALAEVSEGGAGPGRSVAVVGASGGAGASVFAAALATVASATSDVLLLDLDPLGPGQRLLVGQDDEPGITWDDLSATAGRLGAGALRDAVPRRHRLGVLGWAAGRPDRLPHELVGEAVAAAARGHAWVVLDVPRRWDEDVRSVLAGSDHTAVVTRAGIGCLAAAARFTGVLTVDVPAAGLVVRTHRDAPPGADVARALGLELWAEMRDDRRLDEHLALGLGPAHSSRGPLARAASRVLASCVGARRARAA